MIRVSIFPMADAGPTTVDFDLAFLIDSTQSMQEVLDMVRDHVHEWVDRISTGGLPLDIKLALVTYNDYGQLLPLRENPLVGAIVCDFTSNLRQFREAVDDVKAAGGGDFVEDVVSGIVLLQKLAWRPGSARCVILLGDAPPHGMLDNETYMDPTRKATGPNFDAFLGGNPMGFDLGDELDDLRMMIG